MLCTGKFVCIPHAAELSLLSEPRWEKGQNPAEMKECEALVQPPLAFTPGKKKSLKGISQRAVLIRHRSLTCCVAVQHERSRSSAGNTSSISGYLGGESRR